ncbi:MAG: hypothetical protein JWN40_1083 [Phycisphaerales bacterium]|jgi:hypothetical protein|nr:hypothetical protein [Phycisphaerales bacterium]
MDMVPGSSELYVLGTLIMGVGSRLWASSVAPRSGFIPIVLYVVGMFFFAIAELVSERRVKQFLVQSAFILAPAAVMSIWMLYG